MDGVFLKHDTVKNGIKVIEIPSRKLTHPYMCPSCVKIHLVKAIHLYFDSTGATVVHRKVMDIIREVGLPSDIAVGAIVPKAPSTRIDLNTGNHPSLHIERAPINHKIVVHNVGI